MKRTRSRRALLGVPALTICVAVGLMADEADAKKKGKRKGGKRHRQQDAERANS